MMRRLRLPCAVFFAPLLVFCESALGLGLGELELKSALNQRLDAEIALTDVGGVETGDLIVRLAPQEDFDRAGIYRDQLLAELRFEVRQSGGGEYVISVLSDKPINEPALDFMLEVTWPGGRVLKEYILLLDPPVPDGADVYETVRGDRLFRIALLIRPDDSVSVQQTMLALQRANPEAFYGDNINRLKAGQVLRIPDVGELGAGTVREAIAQVRIQNEQYEDYKAAGVTRLDARRGPGLDTGVLTPGNDGELRLLTESGGADAGGGLGQTLAVVREELDRFRLENTELTARLNDLAGQVETLTEIIALKDEQLAALQAELRSSQSVAEWVQWQSVVEWVRTQFRYLLKEVPDNPLVLGGAGLFLVLLLVAVGLLILRRRANRYWDEAEDDGYREEQASFSHRDRGAGAPESVDPSGDADVHLAYGRFPQAVNLLQKAIAAEPRRVDLHLKLLEVYARMEDARAFDEQLEQLKALGDRRAVASAMALWVPREPVAARPDPPAREPVAARPEPPVREPVAARPDPPVHEPVVARPDPPVREPVAARPDPPVREPVAARPDPPVREPVAPPRQPPVREPVVPPRQPPVREPVAPPRQPPVREPVAARPEPAVDDSLAGLFDSADELSLDEAMALGDVDLDLDLDAVSAGEDPGRAFDRSPGRGDLGESGGEGPDFDEYPESGAADELGAEDLSSRLDLARAYMEMGDGEGARALLEEVVNKGSAAEVDEASELLSKLD